MGTKVILKEKNKANAWSNHKHQEPSTNCQSEKKVKGGGLKREGRGGKKGPLGEGPYHDLQENWGLARIGNA